MNEKIYYCFVAYQETTTGSVRSDTVKETFRFLAHLLGFEKLSGYEKKYLHDANIRTSSYMSVIVVLLEI